MARRPPHLRWIYVKDHALLFVALTAMFLAALVSSRAPARRPGPRSSSGDHPDPLRPSRLGPNEPVPATPNGFRRHWPTSGPQPTDGERPARSALGIPSSAIDRSAWRRRQPRPVATPPQRLARRRRPMKNPNGRLPVPGRRRPVRQPGIRIPMDRDSRSRSPPLPGRRRLLRSGRHLPGRPRRLPFGSRTLM